MSGMSMDEFLGHETREGGRKYLKSWKDKPGNCVDTWMHTQAKLFALWQHGIPRLVPRKDKQTGRETVEVWGGTLNCLESEEVLRRQYRRLDNDERELPPTICPMCLLIEHVRAGINDGTYSFAQPLFEFAGTDPAKKRIIRAGGLCNMYGLDKLPDEWADEMSRAGVSAKDGWQESGIAKCNYVFTVVDNDDVGAGIQVAIQTTAVGDAVKKLVRDTMVSRGNDDGNPLKKPYCIRWQYDKTAKSFGDKYRAILMERIPLTEAVRKLIVETPPPDLKGVVSPGNVRSQRAMLERYCLVKTIPWDEIFAEAEKRYGAGDPDDPDLAFPPEEEEGKSLSEHVQEASKAVEKAKPVPEVGGSKKIKPAEQVKATAAEIDKALAEDKKPEPAQQPAITAATEDEEVECDHCKTVMKLSMDVCPNPECGFNYATGKFPEKPAARRSRGASKSATKAAGESPVQLEPAKLDKNAAANRTGAGSDGLPF